MSDHTPLPWKIDRYSDETIAICNERGEHVCILEPRDDGESWREADGDFIVLACNSHGALLAACEDVATANDFDASPLPRGTR